MALLPNFEQAFIDEIKLSDYCLSEKHPVGKHKAKMFSSLLGLKSEDANLLKKAILEGLSLSEAFEGKSDEYGKRFTVNVNIRNFDKQANVVTAWIIMHDENFPRLVICYVKN